ncbi:MAG: Gfo/Idh/MocA family oxidoreductase [Rhodobacteraceae bacterium]|nr:Gfo/Idh/MocA family oxidoreductase [Paracoccaceae bacterium]
MTRPFGMAVVGLGMAAKPHALALRDLEPRIEVRGCFARSYASRQAFAKAYGFPVTEDLDGLAIDPSVDALLLVTPPDARTDIVARFAAAGKHVLSEKPLERTTPAAERIVATCDGAGVQLGVVFQHRFRAASEALAGLLAEGALGQVRIVHAVVPWWREQSYYDVPGRGSYARDGGGVLISQAIHTLDLMLSLTGPVREVQAMAATTAFHRMEAEDFVAGGLRFASGAIGSLMATTAEYPGDAETLTLCCERATAELASGVLTLRWRDGRTERIGEEAGTGGGADPMDFPYDWHRALIADFAEAVATGRPPRVTGGEALRVHRLITALETSAREGRLVTLEDTR